MIKIFVDTIPDDVPAGFRYEEATLRGGQTGWFRYSHEGLVLSTGEHNYYDDSDFYAVVWDEEAGEPKEVGYATTRGACYGYATCDASPEVREKHAAWVAAQRQARQEAAEAAEAATPRVGKTVTVVKGRNVPVGTVAEVVWYGEGRIYGGSARRNYGSPPMRVGLLVDGERVYTDAGNVEVVPAPQPAT